MGKHKTDRTMKWQAKQEADAIKKDITTPRPLTVQDLKEIVEGGRVAKVPKPPTGTGLT